MDYEHPSIETQLTIKGIFNVFGLAKTVLLFSTPLVNLEACWDSLLEKSFVHCYRLVGRNGLVLIALQQENRTV